LDNIKRNFNVDFFDWELFVFSLCHCYYRQDNSVLFDEIFLMMGRGNGKNGFISPVIWHFTTPTYGEQKYNVDIIANNEEQAKTSFNDVYEMLEDNKKSKNFYYWTKELIQSKKTKSIIKFNTANARTKDGKRSACLVFDEIHEYENEKLISVFKSGFGKKPHSRIFNITTQGDVRDGVLDDKLKLAEDVLNGTIKDLNMLPLLYRVDSKKEVVDPEMWEKANPSLKYLPELQRTIKKESIEMKYDTGVEQAFYTKRMNYPKSNLQTAVTEWDNIAATSLNLPDLKGKACTCGVDYTKINDLASVNLHFKEGNKRYDISHSWLCKNSADFKRIVAEKYKWEKMGLLTIVDDVEISPYLITDYIEEQAQEYSITKVGVDNFRYALLSEALGKIGFSNDNKNLWLVRPSDVYKIVPVIESTFNNQYFIWGNNPLLRWATNNVCVLTSGRKTHEDTGNRYYGKQEGKSRKTDPFMALVHSMILEDSLEQSELQLFDFNDFL